jgi:flagellar hook protein FlgE
MAIIRSIFSGVSGLRNHQTFMDVIGNNIANVNTVGFKGGRITFQESFAQTLQGALRPGDNFGGVNAQQLGLGVKLSSVDTLFSQGSLQTTDELTDLAIQGDGFFVISDGINDQFTRGGSFTFDANGDLVSRSTGSKVQGKVADSNGVIPVDSAIDDITIPFGRKLPANATTEVSFTGNLDAGADPLGNLQESKKMYAVELSGQGTTGGDTNIQGLLALNTSTDVTTLLDGIAPNSTTVTISDGTDANSDGLVNSDDSVSFTYVDTDTVSNLDFNSLQDLVDGINAVFGTAGRGTLTASLDDTGTITMTRSADTNALAVTSTNSNLQRALETSNMAADDTGVLSRTTNQFSHVTTSSDLVANLRDENGVTLGVVDGDTITIAGNNGGTPATTNLTLTVAAATTTTADFLEQIRQAFNITSDAGGVTLSNTGRLQVTADGGTENELTELNITASDGTNSRTVFESLFDSSPGNWVQTQDASDVQASAAATVFDSLGQRHVLTLTFTKDVKTVGKWDFAISVNEPADIVGGNTGFATFNTDGSLQSFVHDESATSVSFDPKSGALNPVTVKIDPGALAGFGGITQLGTNSSLVSTAQDGYGLGELESVSINFKGEIIGSFSNGVSQQMAELALATFNNPGGLVRTGDGVFQQSGNSGTPIIGKAAESLSAQITPGALEQSNVDLAEEFTNMIVAQRGFQANARVITVSDQFLTELVNLKT